jgi:hypothetical protein
MPAPAQAWPRTLLILAAAVVLIAGVLARFKGLGSAPLSVDEYYFVRSIENILRSGWPQFSCGGFYTRGLILQYLAAALRLEGLSAELAPRLISGATSLLALPAAYILGRRVHGRTVGILTVILLALSVWEIEMARFGRMYAPFQTVFLWYLVFFLRYTVDRSAKALWPMILLSIAGPLVWEGGIFLPLTNFLPIFLQQSPPRFSKENLTYLKYTAILFVLTCLLVSLSLGGYGAASLPANYNPSLRLEPFDPLTAWSLPVSGLTHHPWWIAVAVVPLSALIYALRWVYRWRSRGFAAAGLVAILIATVLHQFSAVVAITLLLLLMRLISWKELFNRAALPFHAAVALGAVFWLAYGITTVDWHSPAIGGMAKEAAAFAHPFLRFPDFVGVVARPWARAVPMLGIALLLLTGAALLRTARYDTPLDSERAVHVVFVILLVAACASDPARQETRYEFFLYPVALVIAMTTIFRGVARLTKRNSVAIAATSVIVLSGFALMEDFQPQHLVKIDSPAETFRYGMSAGMMAHLEIRDDFPQMAAWLQQRVSADRDVVIIGVHGLDYYYPRINYFFVDERAANITQWACRGATIERWGNYPLLYTVDALTAKIAASSKAYVVVFAPDDVQALLALRQFKPRVAWSQGWVAIVVLQGLR